MKVSILQTSTVHKRKYLRCILSQQYCSIINVHHNKSVIQTLVHKNPPNHLVYALFTNRMTCLVTPRWCQRTQNPYNCLYYSCQDIWMNEYKTVRCYMVHLFFFDTSFKYEWKYLKQWENKSAIQCQTEAHQNISSSFNSLYERILNHSTHWA